MLFEGDFLVDKKYIFSISQIWEVSGLDEIEFGNKIPLWLFGFL